MRPIDLLAFRVDDDHKAFLKQSHAQEKNYKIRKQYQAYAWGRNDDFLLGIPTMSEERKCAKRIDFGQSTSIRDIITSKTFTLALSEDGSVFSWGRGHMGHLGHGNEQSLTTPQQIKFDFRDE
jgi:alpha-tubulin suppressor-like RCC1 family protein